MIHSTHGYIYNIKFTIQLVTVIFNKHFNSPGNYRKLSFLSYTILNPLLTDQTQLTKISFYVLVKSWYHCGIGCQLTLKIGDRLESSYEKTCPVMK